NIARSKVLKPLPQPASDIYLSGFRQPMEQRVQSQARLNYAESRQRKSEAQRMRSEVFDNLRWLSIDLNIPSEGIHTVKVVMIDPEIVVEKLIINPDNEHPTYHGKE
ncbi:MAG: hypothetical protein MJY71_04540, partial [Bacteroidaceae bacterium]|nr:hypothetical protein [Bacteroidaceae bacterium]